MRTMTKATAVVLGGIALAVSGQGMANAVPASAEPAPSCVTAQVSSFLGTTVRVTNGCGTEQRVQVNFSTFGSSYGQCLGVLAPGEAKTASAVDLTRFTGLTRC
ncbi:hypothetical protein ACFVHB_22600 [Kitasatospora sp. NPDC127111]|uniref:hypothetical protein n=1 Tax=Kitasatospora sp. NPDC127111 TaxID=3345363 RepID=UPI003633CE73